MIESKCEACGGKILLSDPEPKTPEEKRAFSREWDSKVNP